MNKVELKIILASKEVESTSMGEFFLKAGYTFAQNYDEKNKENYVCIIDDFLPEILNLPRIKTNPINKNDYQSTYIDFNFLKNNLVENLMTRYFTEKNELDLIDRYSRKFKNIYSLKIQDYLNFGYFIDSVIVEAYKEKFDIAKIRQYLNVGLLFVFKLVERKGSLLPVDMSFSHDGNVFALQIQANIPDFRIKKDFMAELDSLKDLFEMNNFFDLTYVESREKLTISSLWFKDESLVNFHARFYTVLAQRKFAPRPPRTVMSEANIEKIKYSPKKVEKISADEKREIARKISIFTIRTHLKNKVNKPLSEFNLDDLKKYVIKYPNKKESKFIDETGLEMILELIQSSKENFNEVDEALKKIKSKEQKLNEAISIAGAQSDLGNSVFNTQDIASEVRDDFIKIHGENPEEEITLEEIVNAIANKTGTDKNVLRNILNDEDEEISFVKIDENENDTIENEAINNSVENNATVIKEVSQLVVKDEKEIEKLSKEKRDLEIKLEKMKEINSKILKTVDKLKESYAKKLKEEMVTPKTSDEGGATDYRPPPGHVTISQADLLKFRKEIEKKESEFDKERKLAINKEKLFIKIKDELEGALKQRDEKIIQLEKRQDASKEVHLLGQVNVLERQNKELLAKIESANKKIATANTNTNNKDHEVAIKKEKEVEVLKTQLQTAQVLIEKFKTEKTAVDGKLKIEKEFNRKLKEDLENLHKIEKISADPTDNAIKDINIKKEMDLLKAQLIIEKKNSEDKVKNLNGEIRKLEMKNKIMLGQLDEMNRKKGPSQAPKSNENLIKQMEMVNSKMAETTNDLNEKRKENHKMKQENAQLAAKIAELERTLAQVLKKAS